MSKGFFVGSMGGKNYSVVLTAMTLFLYSFMEHTNATSSHTMRKNWKRGGFASTGTLIKIFLTIPAS